MSINAVNSISFGAKAKTRDGQAKEKNRYFKFISQSSAIDSLKLSKGREVEDGKFKLASLITGVPAVIGGYFSAISILNLKEQYLKHYSAELGSAFFEDEKLAAKFIRNTKIAKYGLITSAVLGATSLILKGINETRAEKTANERGFLTSRQRMKMKKVDDAYKAVAEIYNNNIK